MSQGRQPSPSQESPSLHVEASLLSVHGKERYGPAELPLPVQGLLGHDTELQRDHPGQWCRAKVTGMIRTVVGACMEAVFTGAVLLGHLLLN